MYASAIASQTFLLEIFQELRIEHQVGNVLRSSRFNTEAAISAIDTSFVRCQGYIGWLLFFFLLPLRIDVFALMVASTWLIFTPSINNDQLITLSITISGGAPNARDT